MSVILTGLRANGNLHLGNFLGAIQPMIRHQKKLQHGDQLLMFIPDLHSFTTPIDHDQFYQNILENLRIYLAAGLDPQNPNTILYRQSRIAAHSELAWILSCFTYYGELQRMIQFKEKALKQGQTVSVGLFTYPILMAADILLYGAEYIPLGEDQRQHLELARDLAERFNNKFRECVSGDTFIIPKPWSEQLRYFAISESVRIRSLSHPNQKMSKSISDPKGTINLLDDPQQAAKKIMSAQTDTIGEINWDWEKQPGVTNLLQILVILGTEDVASVKQSWIGQAKYGELKKVVAELVSNFLTEFQNKYQQVPSNKLEQILQQGEVRSKTIAEKTLTRAQKAVGLLPSR